MDKDSELLEKFKKMSREELLPYARALTIFHRIADVIAIGMLILAACYPGVLMIIATAVTVIFLSMLVCTFVESKQFIQTLLDK